jgi:putative transposase
MDGRGRHRDNIFIERLWWSLKYEEAFIKAHGAVTEARRSVCKFLELCKVEHPRPAPDYRTPREIFEGEAGQHVDNAPASRRLSVYHMFTGTSGKRKQ